MFVTYLVCVAKVKANPKNCISTFDFDTWNERNTFLLGVEFAAGVDKYEIFDTEEQANEFVQSVIA